MILAIGKNSQLGKELSKLIKNKRIIFLSRRQLDVCKKYDFKKLENKKIKIIINFSAFTNVNIKSSKDKIRAFEVNISGLNNLVSFCKKNEIHLIHISTDYIYKSTKIPKKENFKLKPLNDYAKTKYKGELLIIKKLTNYTIIRTSHLFSEYKSNIATVILKTLNKNNTLKMYNNIEFNPTSANSLSKVILLIINKIEKNKFKKKLIVNFAQFPSTTPFKFANHIRKLIKNSDSLIEPIKYKYKKNNDINRPINSTLDVTKVNDLLKINKKYWLNDLKKVIRNYEL